MKHLTRTSAHLLAVALLFTGATYAQTHEADSNGDTQILGYIDHAWDTLARSMSDCKSMGDVKVTTAPILYLPAAMPEPAAVADMQKHCSVQVKHLPSAIHHMGDVRVSDIPDEGLLYLPHPYVVPGGRFNEMYGWDSYFIVLGLVEDHRMDLARDMVENFFFEIDSYGAILNANRTYYLTRSQPPFLTSMIREVYEHQGGTPLSRQWLANAYSHAERDYDLWTRAPHLAGNTGLARYSDIGSGPVPEMADDSRYYIDVIQWLLAHPNIHTSYLVEAPAKPSPAEAATLAQTSCDVRASKLCANAHVGDDWLSSSFYRGDRAMRESGFDPSFRFGPFDGSTQDYAPVCLNSLLYKYARDMAHFATLLGRPAEARRWQLRAAARRKAINQHLWNSATGMYYDYDFATQSQSTYNYISAFYPLWAGIATPAQAAALEKHLATFEHPGGLAMSDYDSGTQWDLPYGWAPTNWVATQGLVNYGFTQDARRVSREFTSTVRQNFLRDGTIREKYDVVNGSSNVQVATGYKSNVVGFGWTNAVYLKMSSLLEAQAPGTKQTAAAATSAK